MCSSRFHKQNGNDIAIKNGNDHLDKMSFLPSIVYIVVTLFLNNHYFFSQHTFE